MGTGGESFHPNPKIMTTPTAYDSEILTALYKVLDYAKCNNFASEETLAMILNIEAKTNQGAA